MTHTPTLPNGFSRDADLPPPPWVLLGSTYGTANSLSKSTVRFKLRWPTPGDAVLKQLAEGK